MADGSITNRTAPIQSGFGQTEPGALPLKKRKSNDHQDDDTPDEHKDQYDKSAFVFAFLNAAMDNLSGSYVETDRERQPFVDLKAILTDLEKSLTFFARRAPKDLLPSLEAVEKYSSAKMTADHHIQAFPELSENPAFLETYKTVPPRLLQFDLQELGSLLTSIDKLKKILSAEVKSHSNGIDPLSKLEQLLPGDTHIASAGDDTAERCSHDLIDDLKRARTSISSTTMMHLLKQL
ncbi:hypothetical protein [Coralliovum pocilloporae]|uniref:hypothetical protein n=1 Tax=Coralliovum pocilloporae TaxID=3066369 RepID=UPI003306CA3B